MAIYSFTASNEYAIIDAAITADSNLVKDYGDGVDDLVFHHVGLGIYIDLSDTDGSLTGLTVGDGWTSGPDVDNPLILTVASTGESGPGELIVGSDYLILWERYSASFSACLCVGELENGDVIAFVVAGLSVDRLEYAYHLDTATSCQLLVPEYLSIATSSNDKYLKQSLYALTNAGAVYENIDTTASKFSKFEVLLKASGISVSTVEVNSTDIVVNPSTFKLVPNTTVSIISEGVYV